MKKPMARRRRNAFTVLFSRLTLAAFAVTLSGPAAWSQVRATPVSASAGVSVGAAGSALSAPSLSVPASLGSAPALGLAPLAAPVSGPAAAPAAPLAAPAAPLAAAAPIAAAAAPAAARVSASPAAQAADAPGARETLETIADGKKLGDAMANGTRRFDGAGERGGSVGGNSAGGGNGGSPADVRGPAELPVMAINTLRFPGLNSIRLAVGDKAHAALLKSVVDGGGYMIAATMAEGKGNEKGHNSVATLVRLSKPVVADGKYSVVMETVRAVRITGYGKTAAGIPTAKVFYPAALPSDQSRLMELGSVATHILEEFAAVDPKISKDFVAEALAESDPVRLTNLMAQWLPLPMATKLELLSLPSTEARLQAVIVELMGHIKDTTAKERIKAQGPSADSKGNLDDMEGFQAKLNYIGMPAAVQESALKEFARLESMDPSGSEAQKLRAYVEWLTDVPWAARTEDNFQIAAAREILDRDHAGLEMVKERVLEFLAVRKKTGSKKGAIIAFTGPPGVGKTSIAGDIAEALGRKFVRLSLGGVHDESVLRGHGRTYLGSMPGSIIRKMKEAGTVNPVMLLDEVDKIGRQSSHGDPTAALLEILDPEQNNTFRDQYMDVPYDLSQVLFVVTSNDLENIPAPLRDRMEIIEFSGYTANEKIEIAERHIVADKLKEAGLAPGETRLTREALRTIIDGYTREAGVRNLREKIESLFRKVSAWTEMRGEKIPAVVDAKDVEKYLGVRHFSPRQVAQNGVGVATGLAVSGHGGSTLNVEVSWEPGSGQLKLRKQFGDDIEDSAKNAYKYVKLNAAKYGLEKLDFTKIDLDINITPAGKVDGPSAGGLMVTAILSSLTGRPVAPGLAMTGEITARGDVLPIGGLKQKVMAAHNMGYTEVIFPFANVKDVQDIPKEVRDGITLTPVKTYDEIYPRAVVKKATASPASTPAPSAPPAASFVAPAAAAKVWNWWNPLTWPIFSR